MSFQPLNPAFEQYVRNGFTQQKFMNLIGAELTAVQPGICEIQLPYQAGLTQQHGFFHGGVLATLADNAAGFAAYSLMSESQQPLSLEFKINFLSKAQGERLIAHAIVLKNGRTVKICRVDIFCLQEKVRTLCATALASIIGTVVIQKQE